MVLIILGLSMTMHDFMILKSPYILGLREKTLILKPRIQTLKLRFYRKSQHQVHNKPKNPSLSNNSHCLDSHPLF